VRLAGLDKQTELNIKVADGSVWKVTIRVEHSCGFKRYAIKQWPRFMKRHGLFSRTKYAFKYYKKQGMLLIQ
jgi:hypothetical protein